MRRRSCLTLFIAGIFLSCFSDSHVGGNDFFNKLCLVNAEWEKHPEADFRSQLLPLVTIQSYTRLIATHLRLVEQTLRQKDISNLTKMQASNRSFLLNALHNYWNAANFPINDYVDYKTPVFIDRNGTHCAVGYLMQQSGAEELAQKINATEKLSYVREIKTKGVEKWAKRNGFTIHELAWIQPGYMPTTNFTALGTGANKAVKLFCPQYYNSRLAIAGDFDTLNNLPCARIGYYKNDQLYCYGQGLDGIVNGLCRYEHINAIGIAAAGKFVLHDTVYQLATFTDSIWRYMAIPDRPNSIATAICETGGSYYVAVAIQDTSMQGYEEIWFDTHPSGWQKMVTVHGLITNSGNCSNARCFIGAFDSIYLPRQDLPDSAIAVHNILLYDENNNGWTGLQGEVSDTVLAVLPVGNDTYFAGTCGAAAHSKVCITRYLNGSFQPVLENTGGMDTFNYISSFDFSGSTLLYGGAFVYQGFTYCSNLANINMVTNYGNSSGALDAPIRAVVNWNNEFYIGGDFTHTSTNPNLPHLAKIGWPTDVLTTQKALDPVVYPNPADASVEIRMPDEILFSAALINSQGTLIANYKDTRMLNINTQKLAPGLYLVSVKANNQPGWNMSKLLIMH